MSRRPRREFTEEFKRDAVELVRTSGRGIQQVAKDRPSETFVEQFRAS